MSERYDVRLTSAAARSLQRFPPRIADAVIRFLDGPLADNPHRVTKPLARELAGQRSGRIGAAHRILVEMDDEHRIVYVTRIGVRADVYHTS